MIKREVILAKEEATYNTDPTPAAATNAVLVRGLSWGLEGLRIHNREDVTRNVMGAEKPVYAGHLQMLSFQVELAGSGTAGTAPRWGDLIESAGFDETIVVSTSVAYEVVSSGIKSCTIYAYKDGKLLKITGCRATAFSFSTDAGGLPLMNFTFVGHDAGWTDAALVSPTYDGQEPVPFKGAGSFAVGTYSASPLAMAFDIGLSTAMLPDATEADGYGEVTITKRAVTGSITVPQVLKATHDWLTDITAGNELAITTGAVGATAGNIWQIDIPKAVFTNKTPGDSDGVLTDEMAFTGMINAGDDDVKITLT